MKTYKIFASLYSDSLEGWIWTTDKDLGQNEFITVKNQSNGKTFDCFHRRIDENFVRKYNDGRTNKITLTDNITVMSSFYREKINVNAKDTVSLDIRKAGVFKRIFSVNWLHPNPLVQLNYRLTILSFLLGLISLLLTIYSIKV